MNEEQGRKIVVVEANIEAACKIHGVRGHLEHEDIVRMVAEYDEEDRQARIFGKFQHLTGLVFKKFDRRYHVIDPFYINKSDFVVAHALDPHPRVNDAMLWLAVDKKGTKYIIDSLWGDYDEEDLAMRIKEKDEKYRMVKRLIDPSAFNEDKHQPALGSLAGRLSNLYGLTYTAGSKKRADAVKRIKKALKYEDRGGYIVKPPELFIFSTCERLIWEMEHWQWEEYRGKAAMYKGKRETPEDKDDHMIEDLGRLLLDAPVYTPIPTQEAQVVKEVNHDPFE